MNWKTLKVPSLAELLADMVHLALEALSVRKLRTGVTMLMILGGAALITSLDGMTAGIYKFMSS